MIINKWFYVIIAMLVVVVGCSKDEGAKSEDADIPVTFAEARKKGMVDVKYNAELQRLRKIHASPAIKLNTELEAKKAELEAAKSANQPKEKLEALEKEIEVLAEKAAKAEKDYARAMMKIVQMKMIQERESVKDDK